MSNNPKDADTSQAENVEDHDRPYCPHCGEDERLQYNEQYANGEYWTCKECGESFFFNRIKDNQTTIRLWKH